MFSGAPWKLYPRVAFCDCCEVRGKWCQHDSLDVKQWHPGSLCVNSCPSGTKIRGSYFVGFVCLMKWRNHWVKISLSIQPEGWHAWIDQGGVPLISSGFIYFLGNTSNGGMKRPAGLRQVTTVTRDPWSGDWTEDIWRLPFSSNIFMCLCCTVVMPVSSQLWSLAGLCWTVYITGS